MGIEIRDIDVSDYGGQMEAMAVLQSKEARWQFPFDPDLPRYQAMQAAGAARWLGAFDGERMVGYSTLFISPHMYNASVLCAFNEALFVEPEYRNSSAAYKLWRAVERLASDLGCKLIYWHLSVHSKMPKMMVKRGYREADIVMEKEL